jgi:hypothetical protein
MESYERSHQYSASASTALSSLYRQSPTNSETTSTSYLREADPSDKYASTTPWEQANYAPQVIDESSLPEVVQPVKAVVVGTPSEGQQVFGFYKAEQQQYNWPYQQGGLTQHQRHHSEVTENTAAATTPKKSRKYLCWGIGILVFVVSAALIGTGVGLYLQRTGSQHAGGDASSTVTNSSVLATSRISAINWTDSTGVEYHGVFWQAKTAELMMSLWDSKHNQWAVTNISSKMADSSITVKAKSGTPLAAAARSYPWTASPYNMSFGIALFFLSPENTVEEVYSTDIRGAAWQLGDLTRTGRSLQAGSDSQLAVWWSLCDKRCSGDIALFYEDTNQTMRVANQSNWLAEPISMVPNIAKGASLAATGMVDASKAGGKNNADAVRLYYLTSNVLGEIGHAPDEPWYFSKPTHSRRHDSKEKRLTLIGSAISSPRLTKHPPSGCSYILRKCYRHGCGSRGHRGGDEL